MSQIVKRSTRGNQWRLVASMIAVLHILTLYSLLLVQLGGAYSVHHTHSTDNNDDVRDHVLLQGDEALKQLQGIPLATLLEQARIQRGPVMFKRNNKSNKPATCTCTCETKPSDNEEANQVHPSSRKTQDTGKNTWNQLKTHSKHYTGGKQRHHESPATCTCSCETHPANDEAANEEPSHHHKQPITAGGSVSSPQTDSSQSVSLWNPFDYVVEKEENHEEPQSAALQMYDTMEHEPKLDSNDHYQAGVWGHASRFPWKRLPDTMCYRVHCESDSDCCMRYNICDRSAKVCVDCWYGASCNSEKDCCYKYPICKTETYPAHNGNPGDVVVSGKCVDKL